VVGWAATPDNGEQFIVELENATLTNIKGFQAENADLTLTADRADLDAQIRRRDREGRGRSQRAGSARRHHDRLRPAF
jgi:alkyl sulfatase BDS1-like metallo-beta-lactamase superfamily hydrolase